MEAVVHLRGEGERHTAGSSEILIKATGAETAGAVHTFSNATDSPVRFLNFNTPAGWENYMRDLAEIAKAGPLSSEVIGRVASNYDFHPA